MDGIEVSIIPEYATRLNQFQAGRLDEVDILGADLQRVLSNVQNMQLFVGADVLPKSLLAFSRWHTKPQPWSDARVRRAVSMAFDRSSMLDAAYSLKDLEKQNLGVQRRFHNEIPCFDEAFWLDPTGQHQAKAGDPKISDANKLAFSYNPAEAKKLLEAAGHGNGFSVQLNTTRERYGNAYNVITELMAQYLTAIGLDVKLNVVDYNSVFFPIFVVKHEFEGLFHVPGGPGVTRNLKDVYLKGSGNNYSEIVDPKLESGIQAMLQEGDAEKRRIQTLELQNLANEQMYQVPIPLGAVGAFLGYRPGLNNVLTHRTYDTNREQHAVAYYWKA
jgi:ABC-type transport system substrate-binding protein